MPTEEGTWPKVNGDPIYASEYNSSRFLKHHIVRMLNYLPDATDYTNLTYSGNTTLTSPCIVAKNFIIQSGVTVTCTSGQVIAAYNFVNSGTLIGIGECAGGAGGGIWGSLGQTGDGGYNCVSQGGAGGIGASRDSVPSGAHPGGSGGASRVIAGCATGTVQAGSASSAMPVGSPCYFDSGAELWARVDFYLREASNNALISGVYAPKTCGAGGGGGSDRAIGGAIGNGGCGGNGGGNLTVIARNLVNIGSILGMGDVGTQGDDGGSYKCGGGGGGGGGMVTLYATNTYAGAGYVNANGGAGAAGLSGTGWAGGGAGGGGGGLIIAIIPSGTTQSCTFSSAAGAGGAGGLGYGVGSLGGAGVAGVAGSSIVVVTDVNALW